MGTLEPLEYFPATETHLIDSKFVRQQFKVHVVRPPQRRGLERRFPVVYATDGNAAFDMLKGISCLLFASQVECAPFILVSIGYPGESPVAGEQLRGRDFTFPGCPDFCHGVQWPWEGVLQPPPGTPAFGGAPAFQSFIAEELVPFIDRTYATQPGERTYFGHSAGGGFGLFTLVTQSRLFSNYVLSSPILAYDGEARDGRRYSHHDFLLDLVKRFTESGQSLQGIRMYVSVGSEEEFRPIIANWHFTSSFYRLTALLRRQPISGLELTSKVFQGETHITVWPLAFMHGVKALLGGSSPGTQPTKNPGP